MKKGLERIIGKNIVSVVVNQKRGQVFLVFSDETSFEFYGWPPGSVNWGRGIDHEGLDVILAHIRASGDDATVIE